MSDLIPWLIGGGLVYAGFQMGKAWCAYKIVKNPDIVIPLLVEHHPDRIRLIERQSED